MTPNPVPQQPATSRYNRDQWQAIHQRGSNILVSASAGSGKTMVLIERILQHLHSQYAGMDQLLVVTFTNAAAREMKERMEVQLRQAVNETSDPGTQRALIEQLNLLPDAHISTLHSFCLKVIERYFYLIDFDPAFRLVTDETEVDQLSQTAWRQVLAQIQAQNESGDQEELLALMNQFANGRSDEKLYQLVTELHRWAMSQANPEDWLDQLNQLPAQSDQLGQHPLIQDYLDKLADRTKTVIHHYQEALDLAQQISDAIGQKYIPLLEGEYQAVWTYYELLSNHDLASIYQCPRVYFDRWPSNKKDQEDYETIALMKDHRDQAKTQVQQIEGIFAYDYETMLSVEQIINQRVQALIKLTQAFMKALWTYKQSQGVLTYADLEHLTLDILAPVNPETGDREASLAAAYYQAQFEEILVDEYQDINEVQATILSWLSREGQLAMNNNLFMVGDVKQSIYRFRMAEPSLFLAKYAHYQQASYSDGQLIVMDINYRSREEVLAFTNMVFERLMDVDFAQMPYGLQEQLKVGNLSFQPSMPDPAFNVDLLLYCSDHQDESGGDGEVPEVNFYQDALSAQLHMVVQDIAARVAAGEAIYDKDLGAMRPLEYRDIVILSQTRKPFLELQRICEAYQVPLLAQKVENYFQRQEIQVVLALLKLIDNPQQDIPLVAILKSYLVDLDDEDLSKIRIAYPEGPMYQACLRASQVSGSIEGGSTALTADISHKLRSFYETLNYWRHLAGRVSLVELIWQVYEETQLLDYVQGLKNGAQREANLHAFYQRAQSFEAGREIGLFSFIRYIEQVLEHDRDLAEPTLLEEGQNYVRVMTVHNSKGLEYPVVYVVNTEKNFNTDDISKERYTLSKRYGLTTDLYDSDYAVRYQSFTRQAMKDEQFQAMQAEELRKLYVALTRCEQKLIISGTIKDAETWEAELDEIRQQSHSDHRVNIDLRRSSRNWLRWLQQAYALCPPASSQAPFTKAQVNVKYHHFEEIYQQYQTRQQKASNQSPSQWFKAASRQLATVQGQAATTAWGQLAEFNLAYRYPYRLSTRTSSYQSVSELKRLYEEPSHDQLAHFTDRSQAAAKTEPAMSSSNRDEAHNAERIQSIRYTADTFQPPSFIQQTQPLAANERGTITHYFLQVFDFTAARGLSEADYDSLIDRTGQDLLASGRLSEAQWTAIDRESIRWFLSTSLGQRLIQEGHQLNREQAFSYLLPADRLLGRQLDQDQVQELAGDQLLVHGVIDNYFFDEDGSLVMLDYKTDRYRPYTQYSRSDQLKLIVDKYSFQMSLYAQALSRTHGQPVRQVYLVLLDFHEVIELDHLYRFES